MKTLVLIEDNSEVQELCIALIGDISGIQVYCANDGLEGIEIVQTHKPDIVITDFDMPRMNGRQVIEHIRKHEQTESAYIILFTSLLEDDPDIRDAGADLILRKPSGILKLRYIVKGLL